MTRPLQAMVAIAYDDGTTHVWRLVKNVVVDESYTRILIGDGAGPSSFELWISGKGDRTDIETRTALSAIREMIE